MRTNWDTKDIWIRRSFKLPDNVDKRRLQFRLHYDENAEIYINGVLAGKTEGYVTEYGDLELDAKGREAIKEGENTIAVHCRQTGGGQYIDVGLVEVIVTEPARTRQSNKRQERKFAVGAHGHRCQHPSGSSE